MVQDKDLDHWRNNLQLVEILYWIIEVYFFIYLFWNNRVFLI